MQGISLMRDLIRYPITTAEICAHLQNHLERYEQSDAIGSTEGLCLQEALRRVQQYDELATRANELASNYNALSDIVASITAPRNPFDIRNADQAPTTK